MKILRIQLSNLNSLRGDHDIDLEGEPLGSAGIFAITGPTGSGKSTILDAITLALYGRAARYGSSPNPEHMMSRHTGRCHAVVTFEVPSGRYRAEWHLRRARGKSEGSIQPAKRYLYDAAGTVLAEQITKCDEKIEQLCGLDYDRFMRSVLLAQGEFARFLKARANERAELLESLTGTTIYSQLGTLAHAELARRRQELEQRRQQQGMIQLLTESERQERQEQIGQVSRQLTDEQKTLARMNFIINNSDELQAQRRNEAEAVAEQQAIADLRRQSAADLARLDQHQLAVPFLPLLDRLNEATEGLRQKNAARDDADRSFVRARESQIQTVQAVMQMAESLLSQQRQLSEDRQGALRKLQRSRHQAARWLEEHAGDKQLIGEFSRIVEALGELRNIRRELAGLFTDSADVHRQLSEENSRLQQTRDMLSESRKTFEARSERHARAEQELAALLDGNELRTLQTRLESCRERHREIRVLQSLDEQWLQAEERRNVSRQRQDEIAAAVQQEQAALNTAIQFESKERERVTAWRDHLLTAQKIASLEEHRQQLADGNPCPLCGAVEHPYICDTARLPQLTEIQSQLSAAELSLQAAAATVVQLRRTAATAEADLAAEQRRHAELAREVETFRNRLATAAAQWKLSGTSAADLADALRSSEREIQSLNQRLEKTESARLAVAQAKDAMLNAGHAVTKAENLHQISLGEIQRRRDRIEILEERIHKTELLQEKTERKVIALLEPHQAELPEDGQEEVRRNELDKRCREYDDRLQKFTRIENSIRDATQAADESLDNVRETQEALDRIAVRREVLQVLNPAVSVVLSERRSPWISLQAAEEHLNEQEAELAAARERLVERTAAAEEARLTLDRLTEDLAEQLQESDFSGAEQLREARLEDVDVASLQSMKTRMDDQEKKLAGQLLNIRESIERLTGQETAEGFALEGLRTEKRRLEKSVEELIGRIATLTDDLRRDDENRLKLQEQEASLQKDTDAIRIWEILGGLIGSADGSRFRRFAQGISLDVLVRHANRHLARLSERYQLQRVEGLELDLEIVDLYQAGVARPMSSLSGGESFLASLALALGLSDLAGRNVQINSLFIDEGFGTLDPDTLDVALSALDVLRLSQKTVGVISHVALLKERISTQIVVTRQPGGISQLLVRA